MIYVCQFNFFNLIPKSLLVLTQAEKDPRIIRGLFLSIVNKNYVSSTSAPASVNLAWIASASSFAIFSFTLDKNQIASNLILHQPNGTFTAKRN